MRGESLVNQTHIVRFIYGDRFRLKGLAKLFSKAISTREDFFILMLFITLSVVEHYYLAGCPHDICAVIPIKIDGGSGSTHGGHRLMLMIYIIEDNDSDSIPLGDII